MLLKDEKFKVVDCKAIKSKSGKEYYMVTLFSTLGYLIEAFSDKETYDFIKDSYSSLDDLENYIDKRYDKTSRSVSYFFSMKSDL